MKNKILFFARLMCDRKLALCCILVVAHGFGQLSGQRLTRDLNVDLMVNLVGYMPNAGKVFVAKGNLSGKFEVINLTKGQVVLTGNLHPEQCDFGNFTTGDFSPLTQSGYYYIKSDKLRSYPFEISNRVYRSPLSAILTYFSKQRCGSSTSGYLSPCHLDDGIRLDNGKHQDVTGGWHDATDLRKWVSATIYAMIGLSRTYELLNENDPEKEKIRDELLWGNQYFLKMQEPQGYVMNFVGGDIDHPLAEGNWITDNRWTDNLISKGGGEIRLVTPNTGISDWKMLIYGNDDDRIIQTDPADTIAQYNFIISQAIMARIFKRINPNYSKKCIDAGVKCFAWCTRAPKEAKSGIIAASIQAAIEMYKTTSENSYKVFAISQADRLRELQAKENGSGISGFFLTSPTNIEPTKDIKNGCLEFIAICDLINTFPVDKNVSAWKEMTADYSRKYLLVLSRKNSFGIVPYGLFIKDPGGNRKIGTYWYRYFMPPYDWWVGINANIASAGVGLIKASGILNDPELKKIAQRQLDWIIGVNPFHSSTLIGFGHNSPPHYIGATEAFNPFTPVIPGAVMNGLGGDKDDNPYTVYSIKSIEDYNVTEYWTPMVAYTLWLMAELSEEN